MSIKDRAIKIEQLYQELEMKILEEVAKVIAYGTPIDEITNIVDWRVKKLELLGTINTRQKLILAEYSKKTLAEIEAFIEEVAIDQVKTDEKNIKPFIQMGVRDYIQPDNIVMNVLNTMNAMTLNKVNMINANVLNGVNEAYIAIVTKSTLEVMAGNKSSSQAVTEAIKELARKGIPALKTVDSRHLSLEGYIPTVIRSTQKQVANETQSRLYDEYDIDLVEISSHLDSRPSHAPFQGKIYSRSGASNKYPPLEITGYGKIDGLITGINCRHVMYPYIEGVTVKRYKPYSKKDTDKAYRLSQEQRRLEREIRRAKKEKMMLEKAKASDYDIQKAKEKVANKQKAMRMFIKESDRRRRYDREQVRSVS